MSETFTPFSELVDQAVENCDYDKIVAYLLKNPKQSTNDPLAVQRLLNNLNRLNLTQ